MIRPAILSAALLAATPALSAEVTEHHAATRTAFAGLAVAGVGFTTSMAAATVRMPAVSMSGIGTTAIGTALMAGGSLRAAERIQRVTGRPVSRIPGKLGWTLWALALATSVPAGIFFADETWTVTTNVLMGLSLASSGMQLTFNTYVLEHWQAEGGVTEPTGAVIEPRQPVRVVVAPSMLQGGAGIGAVLIF